MEVGRYIRSLTLLAQPEQDIGARSLDYNNHNLI